MVFRASLKNHELNRAVEVTDDLHHAGVDLTLPIPNGPYGRIFRAIEAYRDGAQDGALPHFRNQELLAELICIYAVGIVRGDGEGITQFPQQEETP